MPGLVVKDATSKKRKRTDDGVKPKSATKSKKVQDGEGAQAQILLLEEQILESKKHYKNITQLLELCQGNNKGDERNVTAAVALCRVFCRLLAGERMIKIKGMSEADLGMVDWLKAQYKQYIRVLCDIVQEEDEALQSTSLTLLMRLVKEETTQEGRRAEQAWRTGTFFQIIRALVSSSETAGAREEFVDKYLEEHDDVRYYTFHAVSNVLSRAQEQERDEQVANSLALLSLVEGIPDSQDQLEDWYGQAPELPKHQLLQLSAHKKGAQEAWLTILRSSLTKEQRKAILSILSQRIVPWFTRLETLMDFLTDSYNAGGSSSLLALSGLFYLIQEKNLDYPQFYQKLYSLLDEGILHSKHRSRFFRLLDTFMASTHLPAALVASFIKRLSRLALKAPPGGIVVVIPWIYNMLKKHPACTFMIHRETRDPATRRILEEEGMDDPFDMTEPDPMDTNAIDSSLWEIETLQSHYHPNVATLAKIISEQFTKQSYNLEDFLDHTYAGVSCHDSIKQRTEC